MIRTILKTLCLAPIFLASLAFAQALPAQAPKSVAQIQVTGQPVKIFDHAKDQQEIDNYPDAQATAWKESDGTVNVMIPHVEAYRMRGPDLLHLKIDPRKIYSTTKSASKIPERQYNYAHWLMGPYSLDGQHFFTLTHSEWYACLLNNDCQKSPSATVNSWSNTLNSMASIDGGASWQLNSVAGNHAVARTGYFWTGSLALADKVYLKAMNHSGMFQPTRVIKEGSFYYAICYYIHRDFTKIDPPKGIYQAPVDNFGYVLMRTQNVANPNGWQAWTSGSLYESISQNHFGVFLPQNNGTPLYNAAAPQIVYDTVAQAYILIHPFWAGNKALNYMTTKTLAAPSWSDSKAISGAAKLLTDPAGPVTGFNAANYPSIMDESSAGYNFEFTSGHPLLFFNTFPQQYGGDNTARDLYAVQLTVSYR